MTAGIGDNSVPQAREALKSIIAQIVQTEREKAGVATDIKELYAGAKEAGFNTKALRIAVKRTMESPTRKSEREEVENLVDQYLSATGMLD